MTAVPERTIRNVFQAKYRHTELRTADALVAAIGSPQAWFDGSLEILPNPKATAADKAECCGGSMTGTA